MSIGEDAFLGDENLVLVYVGRGSANRIRTLMEESGFDTSEVAFIEDPEPEEGFEEAHTFNGLVYAGEVMCGIVQVTTGKRTTKDQVKVGGFVMLTDGKRQTIKSVTEDVEGGKVYVETKAGKLGEMELEITDEGFTGSVDSMTVKSGDVGEDTGIISGTLKMSYFDAKTNKLKTRSIKLGGVASGGEAAGTLTTKGEDTKLFSAAIE